MVNDIYDPLEEYIRVFKDKFREVAEQTFAELAAEANVDVEANRRTCAEIERLELLLVGVKKRIVKWTMACVLLWIAVVCCVLFSIACFIDDEVATGIGLVVPVVPLIWLLLAKTHPRLKEMKLERANLTTDCEELRKQAWEQMRPLNRLYDWDIFTRMMTRTVPRLEFDSYFTSQRLADLKAIYDWDDSFNDERSVLYSHSGLINGNPFVFCRTKKMEWGEKTYTGSKTIHWTETYRDSNGKMCTRSRSQTLTATVTAPFPEYFQKTRLIYGNTAAPDLTFTRTHSGIAARQDSLKFKWKKLKLQRKARKLTENDYAMMSNEEFETAFDTSNRNNNQQFALLFTPLAQNSIMSIMKDYEIGYGDDFDFEKERMINTIISGHIQEMNLDMDPAQYRSYSFDKASTDFQKVNAEHFRALYFVFAPLLCVPMYQQIRSQEDIYGRDMKRESAFWEHEAIANYWGTDHFRHPDCVTDCIIKTSAVHTSDNEMTIRVAAHGFRTAQRLTFVRKMGGDGRMHDVPVYWDEYLPVTGNGSISIREDNDFNDDGISQTQRLDHISSVLSEHAHEVYRRHISSRLG